MNIVQRVQFREQQRIMIDLSEYHKYLIYNRMSQDSQISTATQSSLGGIFKYYCLPLAVNKKLNTLLLPQGFSSFSVSMLITSLISNLLKVAIPFVLEYLYTSINQDNVVEPVAVFILIIVMNYYFQLKAEQIMNAHKLKIKTVLCQRAINTALRQPYQQLQKKKNLPTSQITCWSKISANINIFVNGYYISYLTIVFEIMKAIIIIIYLFYKLGIVVLAGLIVSGIIAQFILLISRMIQSANFAKLKIKQTKTSILTQYFARIVDYQMSWLDGFVGDRIDHLQDQYQTKLRKVKLLDAWCVGLWQFTQIGISSVVLCLYYFRKDYNQQCLVGQEHKADSFVQIQPATIIYLFQILTMPINAISWHFAGLKNSLRALNQLNETQRNIEIEKKIQKTIQKFDYGYQIVQIINKVKQGRIYALHSEDPSIFRKLALSLAQNGNQVGYAQQNGFMLPSVLQNLQMLSVQNLDPNQLRSTANQMINALNIAKCQQLPMENLVSTFSGGQKMRLSLARAILHGKFIIIDSDLTSLDKNTRTKVLKNLKDYIGKKGDTVVILKGRKNDEGLQKFVSEFITSQNKLMRVSFELNKSVRQSAKDSASTNQQQKNQERQVIQQKILLEISKLLIFKGFNLSQSKQSSVATSKYPKKMAKKLKLGIQTLKFYYNHKLWHLFFILSLAAMYVVGNYYNYFVNVNKPQDPIGYAWDILNITFVYIVCITFRSLLFATVNLKQSQRISSLTNNLLIYNHISFYDRLNIIEKEKDLEQQMQRAEKQKQNSYQNNEVQQQNSNYKNMNTQKLVCLCTSDEATVNNNFPFSTNILWNNVATVTASLVMVFLQVPIMILFTLVFVLLVKKLEKQFRTNNQSLILNSKDQEIKLMKVVNNIDQGALYLRVFNRKHKFLQVFNQQLTANVQNTNQQTSLSLWVRTNYRFNMILFLVFSIGLFWIDPFNQNQSVKYSQKQSAKMGVMVRYILLLADYIFYLTMSLAECRGQAISIQRIRRFAENSTVVSGSFQRLKRSKNKKEGLMKSLKENQITKSKQFINLRHFSYQYDKRNPLVLENINLRIRYGDRVILKGKTGTGKTTLFKILMGLYPEVYFPQTSIHLMSFSSQHPLKMGECSTLQKLDPYRILQLVPTNIRNKVMQKANKILQKSSKNPSSISYQQQVLINNLRAFLYGFKGLAVFDEPQFVFEDSNTYIVVTHHGQFKCNFQYKLEKGMLFQVNQKQNN